MNSYKADRISEQQYTANTIYSFIFKLLIREITLDKSLKRKQIYKLLGLNKRKSIIGYCCDLLLCDHYDYVHLVGKISGPPSKTLSNKERFNFGSNAKDERSLCELTIMAEFGPILNESDLNTLLNKIFVFMIQVKNHKMNKVYYSRLLNRAEIPLKGKNIDKKKAKWIAKNVNVDFNTLEISEAPKKLVLSQTITKSTLSSSSSSDNFTGFPKESIINLLDFFLTPVRPKETLREMNSLFPNEQVFVINNAILLTPKHMPISTNNDDLILDIQI
ncbi:14805_t:CDS:2 [Cetraspora pellucida]|uniref:14805_t:CDS:1 n=1 Tax=Cetraspora pellucida TaxID=1433469 RepID=A0A9N9HJY2_9GLOM|nr:14805_t:CDS:2 [Cetraspora pellucida]